ncbi:hypothetical protein BH10BAC5_BH10BAC5_07860 [soil metagenome]
MNLEEKIFLATSQLNKSVPKGLPKSYYSIFGKTALYSMDELALITATRFFRSKVYTITSDKIDFISPIEEETIIEIVSKVIESDEKTVRVKVDIFTEHMYLNDKSNVLTGYYTFGLSEESKYILIDEKKVVEQEKN